MRPPGSLSMALLLVTAVAQAQSARTFVSAATGSDLNLCTLAAPCRALSRAVTMTTPNGEVIVLDTGGYGPFTVTQGLSVEAPPGVYAGVTATSGNAIEVNAPATVVHLQGLTIVNAGATKGILYTAGARLTVDRCLIRDAINEGIQLTTGLDLNVLQSAFFGCQYGIRASTASGTAKVAIEGCTFIGNVIGVSGGDSTRTLLSNSSIIGSSDMGAVVTDGLDFVIDVSPLRRARAWLSHSPEWSTHEGTTPSRRTPAIPSE